ncbi:MAG TPA: copper resistance protein CopC [Candidatus Micrarchaeaceae archaeon]|nr:copper resistance protein CopC [Candidatus Micrarchaeaceae archaeon]
MGARQTPSIHRVVPALVFLMVIPTLMVVGARPVEAHSTVVSSRPAPGERLASAPGIVTIQFSEPVNASLSHASISSPDGQAFDGKASSPTEIDILETTNATGIYKVDWTTVSSVDGHVLHGSFEFGVGVTPGAAGEQNVANPQPSDLSIAGIQAVEYLALLITVGMIVLLELARRLPPVEWVTARLWTRLWVPLGVALAAGMVVVVGDAANAAGSLSIPALLAYLGNGLPGFARTVHLAAEALALLFAATFFGPRYVLVPVVFALVALGASGHAAASQPWVLSVSVDGLHLLAAGIWAGGILALATLRPPGGWRGEQGLKLLRRFSWVALPAFGLTVVMGVLRATEELSNVRDLINSTYGEVLDVKVLAIAAMLPLSFIAWRRRRPRPRAEGLIAVVVIAATALLSSFPLPPARAAQADTAAVPSSVNQALPSPTDLTLPGRTTATLVGLTVRPAKPGPNTIWLYLQPILGSASNLDVSGLLGTQPLAFSVCGSDCRSAQAQLSGGETLTVQVGAEFGAGTAVFHLPQLPAPDGTALLATANSRMHGLGTLRIDEELGPGVVPVASQYQMQAPDRMHAKAANGFESVIIGSTEFSRRSSTDPWQTVQIPPLKSPYFIWDSAPPLGAHVVGQMTVDGVPTQEVAFFEDSSLGAIWFQVWIGGDGLIHQGAMTAPGHYMDHHYYGLNAPLDIQPPRTS